MSENEELAPAPENVTPIQEAPRKMSKADEKRQQIFLDRMKRHIAGGKTPDQAYAAIQREDYDRMPLIDKVKRLEGMLVGNVQSIARDLSLLRENEKMLADIFDVNFRGFEKMLTKLGLPKEEQVKLLQEAEAEIKAEFAAREAQKAAAEAAAQEKAQEEALKASVDQPAPAEEQGKVPEGATVFGG